ncbi:MAG: aldehyde dehydrogenase family protein, partial [Acidobacteriota bacterium]
MVREYKFFLAGDWVESGEWDEITNPYNGELVGRAALPGEEHLEAAIRAAQRAFEETRFWSACKRADALDGIVAGLTAREEELAEMITRESGKPIKYSRGEVTRAISTFTLAREEARRIGGEVLPLDITERTEGYFGFVTRVPIGPISAITPFNFPLNLVAHKVAPALACGNPIVLKPPHQTPLTSLLLAEIVEGAGAVPGSFSVLPLPIESAAGLIEDGRFKLLSFTGSARVGWELKAKAGKKRVALELGGNAAAIVHSDADLDWAAERCAIGGFAFAG